MFVQLNPPLPLITPMGPGWAHGVIDYSQEHHLLWVTFLDGSGECWCVPNREVRLAPNWSFGRVPISEPPAARQREPGPAPGSGAHSDPDAAAPNRAATAAAERD